MSKVVEKVTSTDNSIVRFNGTTGDVQNSGVIIDDSNNVNTSGSIYSANMVGFKNYIINGNFDIWQRGTSQTSVVGYGSDDRWYNGYNGSTRTHSQVACTDTERALFNASYFSRTVVSSVAGAANFIYKAQHIENVTKLAGKTVTLSFWAKADSAKNISVELIQNFGTGGSPSSGVSGVGISTINLTTTWQKKTITITIPNIVGKTLGTDGVNTSNTNVQFWFEAGSSWNSRTASLGQQSGTFDIAQVQLEEGSVATPFEQRPYGLELSLCQRYYQKSFAYDVAPTNGASVNNIADSSNGIVAICPHRTVLDGTSKISILFPVEMRIRPTIQRYGNSEGNWKIMSTDYNGFHTNIFLFSGTKGLNIANEASATYTAVAFGHYTADAEL